AVAPRVYSRTGLCGGIRVVDVVNGFGLSFELALSDFLKSLAKDRDVLPPQTRDCKHRSGGSIADLGWPHSEADCRQSRARRCGLPALWPTAWLISSEAQARLTRRAFHAGISDVP